MIIYISCAYLKCFLLLDTPWVRANQQGDMKNWTNSLLFFLLHLMTLELKSWIPTNQKRTSRVSSADPVRVGDAGDGEDVRG